MNECTCPHEAQIERNRKAIEGNGDDGLKGKIIMLKLEVKHINESVSDLSRAYKALADSQIENDAMKKKEIEIREKRLKLWQIIGIAVPTGATILGAVKLVLNYLMSNT